MKKMLCSLLLLFLLCGCQNGDVTERETPPIYKEGGIQIPLIPYTYEYIERELSAEDFSFIKKGTTMQEVTEKLGEPNGTSGSGLLKYFYHLEDDSTVELFIGENEEIYYAVHSTFIKNGEAIRTRVLVE